MNGIIPDYGVAISDFSISALKLNNSSYEQAAGTSRAAPHVAGLAAMIWTFNPSYTYIDVIESIRGGGESVASLTDLTSTGKAVNAFGSLRFVTRPTGVSVLIDK